MTTHENAARTARPAPIRHAGRRLSGGRSAAPLTAAAQRLSKPRTVLPTCPRFRSIRGPRQSDAAPLPSECHARTDRCTPSEAGPPEACGSRTRFQSACEDAVNTHGNGTADPRHRRRGARPRTGTTGRLPRCKSSRGQNAESERCTAKEARTNRNRWRGAGRTKPRRRAKAWRQEGPSNAHYLDAYLPRKVSFRSASSFRSPLGYPRKRLRARNKTLAGRSASRLIKYGYHALP